EGGGGGGRKDARGEVVHRGEAWEEGDLGREVVLTRVGEALDAGPHDHEHDHWRGRHPPEQDGDENPGGEDYGEAVASGREHAADRAGKAGDPASRRATGQNLRAPGPK